MKTSVRLQKLSCYTLLVFFAAYVGYAGGRWVDASISQVYPLAFSPNGKHFIEVQVVDGSNTIRRFRVRDAEDGSVVADLSDFEWIDGYRFRWSPDGTHIGGVARTPDRKGYRIVAVRVRPQVKLAAEYPFDHDGRLQGIDFTDQNELITQHYTLTNSLEFRTAGKVTATFRVGNDESVRVRQTIGNVVQVRVFAQAKTDRAGNLVGEFLHTDGQQHVHLWLDKRDGSVLSKVVGDYEQIQGSVQRILRRSKSKRGLVICDRDKPNKPLVELPIEDRPVLIFENQALTVNYPPRAIYLCDLSTGEKKLLAESDQLMAPNGPSPRPIFADGKQKLVRVNLADGKIGPLVDLTISPIWKWSAVIGLPLLWLLWITVGVRFGSRLPFLDMIALCVLTLLATMIGSMLFLREYRPDLATTAVGMVGLATAAMLVLIWGTTTKTFWGTLLPSSIACTALVVLFIRIWSYNSSFRIVEGLVGGTIGLGSQIVGLWLLRKFAGRIVRCETRVNNLETAAPHVAENATSSFTSAVQGEAQMTMRQGLALMVSFCVLFAVVSQATFSEFLYPGVWIFVLWLALFASQMSFAGVTATYAALRWNHTVVSFLSAVGVSSLYSILVYALTRSWQLNLLISPLGRWILPVICGAIVWVAMRYCAFHGFRFERLSTDQGV